MQSRINSRTVIVGLAVGTLGVLGIIFTNMGAAIDFQGACQAEVDCKKIVDAMKQAQVDDLAAGKPKMTAGELLQLAANRFGYGISSVEPDFLPDKLSDTDASLNQIAWIIYSQVAGGDPTLVSGNLNHLRPQAGLALSQGMVANIIKSSPNGEFTLGYPCFDFNKVKVNGLYNFYAVDNKVVAEEIAKLRARKSECLAHANSLGVQENDRTRVQKAMAQTAKALEIFGGVFGTQYRYAGQTRDLQINYKQVLHEFWFNRFNVEYAKVKGVALGRYSYESMIELNQLSNFKNLLTKVTKSPTMLVYLDNNQNRYDATTGAASNQNLGREILELHSFGVGPKVPHYNSPYNQIDVEISSLILAGHATVSGLVKDAFIHGYIFAEGRAFKGSLKDKYWTSRPAGSGLERPLFFNEARLAEIDSAINIESRLGVMLSQISDNDFTANSVCRSLTSRFALTSVVQSLRESCLEAFKSVSASNLTQLQKVALSFPSNAKMWSRTNFNRPFANPLEIVTHNIRSLGIKWSDLYDSSNLPESGKRMVSLYNFMEESIHNMGLTYKELGFPTGYEMVGINWVSQGYLMSHARLSFYYAHLDRYLDIPMSVRKWTTSSQIASDLGALPDLPEAEGVQKLDEILFGRLFGRASTMSLATPNAKYFINQLVTRSPAVSTDRDFMDGYVDETGKFQKSMTDTVLSNGLANLSMMKK